MKLNHLNLTVANLKETHDFLVKYFGLKPRGKASANMALLEDDGGLLLTLMSAQMTKDPEFRYPSAFHIGFVQENEQEVDEINRRLKADGFEVPPPSRQHGSWTFYFDLPEAFTIEVLAFGAGQFGSKASEKPE